MAAKGPGAVAERDGLLHRVAHGVKWSFLSRLVVRSSGFVSSLVFARMLSPDHFGLIAFSLTVLSFTDLLGQFGFKQYIIQKSGRTEALLGTAWVIEIAKGLISCLALLVFAGPISTIFSSPDAAAVLRLMALIPVLKSLQNIRALYFIRNIEMRNFVLIESTPPLVLFVIGAPLAVVLPSVWTVAGAYLLAHGVQLAVSYLLCGAPPRLRFSFKRARMMLSFGISVMLGGITIYPGLYGGVWLAAFLLGGHEVGLYSLVFSLCHLAVSELAKPINGVLFPAYARVREDRDAVRRFAVMAYEVVLAVILPLTVGVGLVAGDFIPLALGEKWLSALPLFPLMAAAAAMRCLSTAGAGLFPGLGHPEAALKTGLFTSGGFVLAIVLLYARAGAAFSLEDIVLAVLSANLTQYLAWAYYACVLLGMPYWRLLGPVLRVGFCVLLMAAVFSLAYVFLPPGLWRLAGGILAGGLGYVAGLFLLRMAGHGALFLLLREFRAIVRPA